MIFIITANKKLYKKMMMLTMMSRTLITSLLSVPTVRSETLVDLGSGDGRIVIEAAKKGYSAVGYELNYWLVLYSR